ncbi:hypothetical protein ACGFIW_08155 [Micromonospora sp. NPDC048935]|uniref:hypothetical protein n=1 Tax=Micromonospora sp. NPDC048935 TaxID=3364262 RepID=UPI003724737E
MRPSLAPGTGKVVADQAGVLGVAWIASADIDGDRQVAAEHPDGLEVKLPSGGGVRIRLLRHDRETFSVVQDFVAAELLITPVIGTARPERIRVCRDPGTRPDPRGVVRAVADRPGTFVTADRVSVTLLASSPCS